MRPANALLLALLVASCAQPCEVPRRDTAYLLWSLSIEQATRDDGRSVAPGFDLDGLVTARPRFDGSCVDANEDHEYRGVRGIDNATAHLAGLAQLLAPEPIELEVARKVVSGQLVLLLDVRWGEDGGMPSMRIVRGEPVSGAIETIGERPRIGQAFRVVEVMADVPVVVRRRCAERRDELTAIVPAFTPVGDGVVRALPLEHAEVTHVGISTDGLTLRDGWLGGSWTVDDVADWVADVAPAIGRDQASVALSGVADLDPDPSDPITCRRLSFALRFEAVTAELVD
ncbi:Hypothetical protein I5071_38250 [Sandaracinus amylolyticus]|nr:Hypothetical protein I5071_38250 [Sandaracinus amylolyticus]